MMQMNPKVIIDWPSIHLNVLKTFIKFIFETDIIEWPQCICLLIDLCHYIWNCVFSHV